MVALRRELAGGEELGRCGVAAAAAAAGGLGFWMRGQRRETSRGYIGWADARRSGRRTARLQGSILTVRRCLRDLAVGLH